MSGFERGEYGVLSDMHRQVFERFTYITDQEKFGLVEHWEDSSTLKNIGRTGVSKFTGDCEEFALVSMDRATRAGFKARLVVAEDENKQGHCLCEISSHDDTEAYYFDNRLHKLGVRKDLKYKFVAVSPWNPIPADTRPWLKVKK